MSWLKNIKPLALIDVVGWPKYIICTLFIKIKLWPFVTCSSHFWPPMTFRISNDLETKIFFFIIKATYLTSINKGFEVQPVNMIFKMRFFDNFMTSYLKILKIDQSPKIIKYLGVYLVGIYTFLTSLVFGKIWRFWVFWALKPAPVYRQFGDSNSHWHIKKV